MSDSDRETFIKQYGDRAVELLRRAVDAGFSDAERLSNAADWETLRQRNDYQEVLQSMDR